MFIKHLLCSNFKSNNAELDIEMDKQSKEEIFKKRLRTELVSRDGHGYEKFFVLKLNICLKLYSSHGFHHFNIIFFDSELSKDTTWSLRFKNTELEDEYVKQRESLSSLPLIASLLVLIVGSFYSSFILPSSVCHFFVILAPIILLLPIIWISVAESFPKVN